MDDTSSFAGRSTAASDDALTTARIENIRGELERELARLKHRLTVALPSRILDVCEGQHAAAVDDEFTKQCGADFRDRLQERCAEILGALDRIQKGSYGRCAICGERIPYTRLEVVPETRTCITCCR
jgi:RNA polymerase-binding transcription factor DksA